MRNNSESLNDIISRHQNQLPVPIVKIAHEMGVKVYRSEGWPDYISGLIRTDSLPRGGTSGYAIYTNASHPKKRRRFTIAHELGHYVLHRNLIGNGITDDALYRSRLDGPIERQANRFAAMLLMPWNLIVESIEQGIDTVEELAEKFDVPKSAMSIRLEVPFETEPDYSESKMTSAGGLPTATTDSAKIHQGDET